jgi:hypothetical protein
MADGRNKLADLLARAGQARAAGDLAAAEKLYAQAVREHPDEPEPLHHLGGIHLAREDFDKAEAAYRRVLALAPNADSTGRVLGTLLLSRGAYEEGFAVFEARHASPPMSKPDLPFPEWRGEPVAGRRLLIWPEQGFGDQIQMARFAPILKAMGAELTLLCRPGLVRLFQASLGVTVLAAEGKVDIPDPDFWVMQGSIGWRIGVTPETIPAEPYLRAPGKWPALGEGFKVGLRTSGNPGHENDANRSLPREAADGLRALPVRTFDLDPAATGATDFADTAAILDQLDLVISVDTAVAHLAGAMGKPCWTLLPRTMTDWRWMRGRTDSPWYPSMRLYRQETAGDWAPVLEQVAKDLAALTA